MSSISFVADETEISREKQKARELRASQWWKRRLAKGVCHYCGSRFPLKDLTMDHIVPISKGGKTTKGNVVVCCKACNTEKKSKLLMEWGKYLNK
jgi:5-methylcytosine-specific restriction endonuclease McrA